jgi:hypothetical protein
MVSTVLDFITSPYTSVFAKTGHFHGFSAIHG